MDKAEELKSMSKVVMTILEEKEKARNSDMYLYVEVCRKLNPDVVHKPFWLVMLNLKEHGLPCIETIRRARQKIQAAHPELAGCKEVVERRQDNEVIYRKYARGG